VKIRELLTADLVIADLDVEAHEDVIGTLAMRLAARHPAIDGAALADALRARERQMSTAVGEGVAVPHARIAGIDRTIAAFGRSRRGVAWDAPDGLPAHFVFALAGPADAPSDYLKVLSHASRLLSEPRCRARLRDAGDAADLLAVLCEEEARTRPAVRAA
jgi:mannitol/fructose-specific phosphotransferase system IIA component (Ntr-type)